MWFEQSENRGKKEEKAILESCLMDSVLPNFWQLFKTENSSPLSQMIGQVWEGVKIDKAPSLFSVLATREVLNFEENQVANSSRNK